MTWPLIERELRTATRKPQLRQTRLWGTIACAVITMVFLLTASSSAQASWGGNLNHLLFWGGLIIILQVPSYTVGIFAEERRNQTLGLLFLCGICPTEMFLSKTLGSALVSFSRLLLLYPFLAISFLGGGLSPDQFLATAISLPVLLLFVISVCVLASVLCQEESTALFVASGIAILLCGMVPLIHELSDSNQTIQLLCGELLVFSPARSAYLALNQLSGGTMSEFWNASAVSTLWSALFLCAAGIVLSRVWQDKPDTATQDSVDSRLREWICGNSAWRKQLSQRWSDLNPYVWLALRDRWLLSLAWIVIGGVMLLWLVACVWWPHSWIKPANFFLTAILLNYMLNWISIFAAAKTIGDNRRSGALELLLTTPLSHLDIIRGQLAAMREQFRPIARAVLIFEIIMFVMGLQSRFWTPSSFTVYLVVWAALMLWTFNYSMPFRNALIVFWDSLVCGRPAYVALKHAGFTPSPAMIAYWFFIGGNLIRMIIGVWMSSFPSGSITELVLIGVVAIVLICLNTVRRVRQQNLESRLATDFRAIATKPVPEPSDPRYKHWKSGEHFPDMFADVLVGRVIEHMSAAEKAKTRTATSR